MKNLAEFRKLNSTATPIQQGQFVKKAMESVSYVHDWQSILGHNSDDANLLETGLCNKFHLPTDEKGKFHWEDLEPKTKYDPVMFINHYAPNATAREKLQLCTMRANAAYGSYRNILKCLNGEYGEKARYAVKNGTGVKSAEYRLNRLYEIAKTFSEAVANTYGPLAELETTGKLF